MEKQEKVNVNDFFEEDSTPVDDNGYEVDESGVVEPEEDKPKEESSEVQEPKEESKEDKPNFDPYDKTLTYYQSEKDKAIKAAAKAEAELEALRRELESQRKPAEPKVELLEKPTPPRDMDDPIERIDYQEKLLAYQAQQQDLLTNKLTSFESTWKEREEAERKAKEDAAYRSQTVAEFMNRGDSFEKASKKYDALMGKDSIAIDNMYKYGDLLLGYTKAGSPKKAGNKDTLLPPGAAGNGNTEPNEEKTPDEQFTDRINQNRKLEL